MKGEFMSSEVSHPRHYNQGKFEVIEVIEDQHLNFHRGNALKYLCRAGKKDPNKEIQDLEKAVWYLNREIERLRAIDEKREPIRPNDMVARPPEVQSNGRPVPLPPSGPGHTSRWSDG